MGVKSNLIKGSIQETMLGPLWARAKYSQLYPKLLDDPKAIEIKNKIDYDFSQIQEYLGEWRGLGLLARARNFDNELKLYIKKFPYTTVVNIAAGLDTSYFRIDNKNINWYELDLPEAIEFRKTIIPESENYHYIAKSAFDFTWFNNIDFIEDKGIFFIVGGFTYYFKEDKNRALMNNLANQFPGAEMIFDTTSKLANKIFNRKAKKAGEHGLRFHFAVNNPDKIFPTWSPKIQVIEWYTIWSKIIINPNWHKKVIKAIKMSERVKAAKIVHLKFKE